MKASKQKSMVLRQEHWHHGGRKAAKADGWYRNANGAPLARFGLGVGCVEFWISTRACRVENSAIFGERFFACVGLGARCGRSHTILRATNLRKRKWILYYDTANRSRVRACMALLRKDKVKSVIIIARAQKRATSRFSTYTRKLQSLNAGARVTDLI